MICGGPAEIRFQRGYYSLRESLPVARSNLPYACMLVNYLEHGPPQALMKLPPWIPAATVLLIQWGQREESHWLMLVGCGPCRRLIKPNFIFCQC